MSEVVVYVSLKKPFTVVQSDHAEFEWMVVDAEGEPIAYCPDMPTAELLVDALEKEPAKLDVVTFTVNA